MTKNELKSKISNIITRIYADSVHKDDAIDIIVGSVNEYILENTPKASSQPSGDGCAY